MSLLSRHARYGSLDNVAGMVKGEERVTEQAGTESIPRHFRNPRTVDALKLVSLPSLQVESRISSAPQIEKIP